MKELLRRAWVAIKIAHAALMVAAVTIWAIVVVVLGIGLAAKGLAG